MFCEKENLSVRREKKFKVWKGKNVSVEFRVFGKKMKLKEKFRKKNQSVFGSKNNCGRLKCKILLSSHSLVGLYVD